VVLLTAPYFFAIQKDIAALRQEKGGAIFAASPRSRAIKSRGLIACFIILFSNFRNP